MTSPSHTASGRLRGTAAWLRRIDSGLASYRAQRPCDGGTRLELPPVEPRAGWVHPVAAETDLPNLDSGFALRYQLVRLARAVERADQMALRHRSEGARLVYLTEVRNAVQVLVEIVNRGGWPGRFLVGADGLAAALTIASNAGLSEQIRLLPALEATVRNGGAPEEDLTHLAALIARAVGSSSLEDAALLVKACASEGAAA
ncbi:hypothetical protein BOQ63_001140 (plasmid) [Streptomyces viridifaciens]|nr:hypothetical protein BOQ63_001140 [Streptomyces viridifaciens]